MVFYSLPVQAVRRAALWTQLLSRGMYARQLQSWYHRFAPHQFHVLCSHDLLLRPASTLSRVAAFLRLEPFDFERAVRAIGRVNTHQHPGYTQTTPWDEPLPSDPALLTLALRTRLADFFRPHNQALRLQTGVDCGWANQPG